MADLEPRLRELGTIIDYPSTPPITEQVGRNLREGIAPRKRGRRAPRLRVVLIAAAALLLLAAGATAAVPSARHAVLDFLGLRSETVQRIPSLPENVRAKPSWHIGQPMTLEAAEQVLPFSPLLPTSLGEPNGVFVSSEVPGGALTLTYAPRPGLPREADRSRPPGQRAERPFRARLLRQARSPGIQDRTIRDRRKLRDLDRRSARLFLQANG